MRSELEPVGHRNALTWRAGGDALLAGEARTLGDLPSRAPVTSRFASRSGS